MNRNNRNSNRTFRNKALVGAIAAALALGAAGTAMAQQTTNYALSTTWAQTLALNNFLHSVNNSQTLGANVTATINDGQFFYDGDGTGSPSTVNDNSIRAFAAGNDASGTASATNPNDRAGNSIDLGLLGADTNNSGLGILSGQLNNANTVKASVTDSDITTALTNHTTGAVTESNDSISANSQINNASNSIAGELPTAAFTGSTAGSTQAVQPRQSNLLPSSLGASGDIVIANAQANANNTTSAKVTNSNIAVTDNAAGTVSADFTNGSNTIQAGFSGNSAGNAFDAHSGGAVSYAGSVVLGNAQLNDAASGSAAISNSNNNTVVNGAGNFTGTVSQSGNRILAGAQGNSSDNSIAFADGISLAGNGGTASLPLVYKYSTRTSQPTASADLTLLNSQTNDGSSFSSSISNSNMRATVNAVGTADASVTLDDNSVLASAGANTSSNKLRASGASFADSVAVGNLQANNITPTSASINGSRLQATMSAGNRNSLGDVSVSGNQIGSSAAGNAANTSVDLAGTSFNSGVGTVTPQVGVNVVGATTDALDTGGAGINVGNLQINKAGSDVSATTADTHILAEFPGNNVIGGATTIDGNAVSASAFGSDATTSVALSGANGVLSASLGSFQDNESDTSASVSASDIGLGIGLFSSKNASDTTLTVSGNSMSAGATANRDNNVLSTDFTNATLGAGGAFAAASNSISHNVTWFGSNKGHAALALLSNQYANGNVTAGISQGTFGTNIVGNASDSAITTSGNSVGASATANNVGNTLDPGVGSLSTDNGQAAQIATLGNVQNADKNDVSASVGAPRSGFVGRIVTQVAGNLSGSEMSVSDNDVSAFAGGNMAGNGMAVTGTNFAPATVGGTNGQSTFNGAAANAWATWTEQNVQDSIGGSRSATIDNGSIGATVGGNITNSPLTVNGNTVGTDARDNYASNGLSLSGFSTLDTTAALQSVQHSEATLTSKVTDTSIGAGAPVGNITSSNLTVSGNGISAKALGNTVFNSLGVQAGQLSGNGAVGQHGANPDLAGTSYVLADYGLGSTQDRSGAVAASVSGGIVADGMIGGGAAGNVNGGSMTVTGNGVTALAQSNSANNALALSGTSITASAAMLNKQTVESGSNASATISSAEGFVAYAGGTLGASLATPVTVSGNSMVAQAGQNEATNALTAGGASAIAGDGTGGVGADNSTFQDAIADYALYNGQSASSSATASVKPGLSGVEVDGAIGNAGAGNALTVSDNSFAASASANGASNAVSLTGAASITASAALTSVQSATGGAISATASGAQVGIVDGSGATVRNAALTVSGNNLSAQASGNSAGNIVQNLPVALNAGNLEPTIGQAGTALNSERALANNALLNVQNNADTISATISNGSIGVNPTASLASPLLNSTAMVGGNVAAASASGNSASNSIMLASLSTGVSSSALVSNQINSANITATVSNVQIGVNAGIGSSSPVTVSGNTISATGVGNSAINHIGISN